MSTRQEKKWKLNLWLAQSLCKKEAEEGKKEQGKGPYRKIGRLIQLKKKTWQTVRFETRDQMSKRTSLAQHVDVMSHA
jgi:hypothetical protein